jgi:hypothetical protein
VLFRSGLFAGSQFRTRNIKAEMSRTMTEIDGSSLKNALRSALLLTSRELDISKGHLSSVPSR